MSTTPPRSTIDGAEAARIMTAARRSYALAELIQERRTAANVDSAIAAHRALTALFGLLVRLHGDAVPGDFAALAEQARTIAEAEGLLAEDLAADLAVVDAMRRRVASGGEVTGAEDRHYDRALSRSAGWFDGVQSYLDERFPPSASERARKLRIAVGALLVFSAGIVVGRHVMSPARELPASAPVAKPSNPAAAAVESAEALQRPLPLVMPARVTIADGRVTCVGCWPPEGSLAMPYAWTSGKAEFAVRGLAAEHHYKVALRITDPGHSPGLKLVRAGTAPPSDVSIENGIATAADLLLSDDKGTLRFTLLVAPWKPKDFVNGSADTRDLGVAVGDIRIDEP